MTFCNHDNEVPVSCTCDPNCLCYYYTCISFKKAKHNEKLTSDSGSVEIHNDKLTSFLYELIRDYLPIGTVETLIKNAHPDIKYTNGWLAKYAQNLAERLR